jgi:predicted DNA-binding WGR domain protein
MTSVRTDAGGSASAGVSGMLTVHRREPARNMARFYAVSLQADLLNGWSVVREWGRIVRPGRVRVDLHGGSARAQARQSGWSDGSGARVPVTVIFFRGPHQHP